MAPNTVIKLNNREVATVLAALRLFQSEADYDSEAVYSMEQFRDAEPLGNDEIDEALPAPQWRVTELLTRAPQSSDGANGVSLDNRASLVEGIVLLWSGRVVWSKKLLVTSKFEKAGDEFT